VASDPEATERFAQARQFYSASSHTGLAGLDRGVTLFAYFDADGE